MGARLRIVAGLLTACMALPMFALPASAGAFITIWVDADGMAGPSNCAQSTPASTTIQAGIDLSGIGDTVKVCPGTYAETVVVNGYDGHSGISLVSVKPWKAKIISPDDMSSSPFGATLLSIYAANDVTVRWFAFRAKTFSACQSTDNAIDVFGGSLRARIIANQIRPTGPNTYDGTCQLSNGIRVEGPSTAVINYNLIKDWLYDGINVTSGAKATIKRNSMRSRHLLYSGGACLGIGVESNYAAVVMKNNAFTEPAGAHYCGGTGFSGNAGSATVTNNSFNGFRFDVYLFGGISPLDVGGNTITGTPLYGKGIWVASDVSGATIHDNDARGNADTDCEDDSTGAGTASTANTWTNNRGTTLDSPDGICSNP